MIIQCKQCRTKFRFDDSNMQGSGIWLRCSRCGHVYFQENPNAKKGGLPPFEEPEIPPAAPSVEPKVAEPEQNVAPSRQASKPFQETPSVFHRDEKGMKTLNKIMQARRRSDEETDSFQEGLQDEKPAAEADIMQEPEDIPADEKQKESIPDIVKPEKKKKESSKGSGRLWKTAVWSVLVIVIIPAAIYFYALPQYGEQLVGTGDYLMKKFNEYRGVSEPVTTGAVINQAVKIQDVRYRRIDNYILGPIGVLEGTAVNGADFPISRIKLRGEIVDAYSVVLDERLCFAGNVLTDEELMNLSEEEILTKLLQPEGLNHSNDRINPAGRLPFMIVFPNEPADVIKTTVMTIGAERLL